MLKILKYFIYQLQGRKPWGRGYVASRDQFIKKSLIGTDFNIDKLSKKYGTGFDERVIEYPWLLSRLSTDKTRLLDAGSVLNFDYILDHPKLSNKRLSISTLAPETNCYWSRGISYVYEDLRKSCFLDSQFDEIVSLSTLEHVGFDNSVYTKDGIDLQINNGSFIDAVMELKRLLKPGGKLFISVPFGKNINHDWFQVFDGSMIDHLLQKFSPTNHNEWIYKYERDLGWKKSTRDESKDSLYFEKTTLQLGTKDKIAAAEAVVCLELIK